MKKAFTSLAALFLAQLSAFAVVDLGSTISRTPYEAYMSPVKQVFSSLNGTAPDLGRVAALMRQGRGFRYAHTDPSRLSSVSRRSRSVVIISPISLAAATCGTLFTPAETACDAAVASDPE